jgi:hypothetical protein
MGAALGGDDDAGIGPLGHVDNGEVSMGRLSNWYRRSPKRVWVQDVDVSASLLEAQLPALAVARRALESRLLRSRRRSAARHLEQLQAEWEIQDEVCALLDRARQAARRKEPLPNRVVNWWGGRLIEASYQNLHAAEALMVELYPMDRLIAEAPEAVARVEAGLDRDDPRVLAARGLMATLPTMPLRAARAEMFKTIEVGHSAADHKHSRLRGFRNAILGGAGVIAVLLLSFGAYVWCNPEKVPLCFSPTIEGSSSPAWVCPTGQTSPPGPSDTTANGTTKSYTTTTETTTNDTTTTETTKRDTTTSDPTSSDGGFQPGDTDKHDILVVALLGLLGGALSAAVAIRNLNVSATPYDVSVALATLKFPLGALTAIGGLIALQGDFIPGLSELDSQGQILAYALVLGYSQQLLTGLLDKRADQLLESVPGKDHGRGTAAAPPTAPPVQSTTTHKRRHDLATP